MKNILLLFITLASASATLAQQRPLSGIWEGDLIAGPQKLKLVFTISGNDDKSYSAYMESPQQSAAKIPADTVINSGDSLYIELRKFGVRFSGSIINDSSITGEFFQGRSFALQLKKVAVKTTIKKANRPQTPVPPFPYQRIDTSFTSKDGKLKFGATLTLPSEKSKEYPAVLLISGSGPQDRDETIFGHKPFAVIADHLTKQGFAVLRVDDRGVGKSTGNHAGASSEDFAKDVEAGLDFLMLNNAIDKKNIGLIGHSEGGMIAPIVAARRKEIKFIVLLAGPGIPGADLLAEQNVAIFQSNGMAPAAATAYGEMFKTLTNTIAKAKDSVQAMSKGMELLENWTAADSVKKLFKVNSAEGRRAYLSDMVATIYTPWFRYFVTYDPAPNLQKLTAAVLALNGSRDLQVLPTSNLAGIKKALLKSKASTFEIKEIPQLNHLFQTCTQCTVEEYGSLEESFSPAALNIMSEWLMKQVR